MANYNPTKEMKPFKYWVQSTLPMVYDDTLTYYELLSKVIAYINQLIENDDALIQNFEILKEYVDTYFENLDVSEEINKALDEMAESGQLTDIIGAALASVYSPAVVSSQSQMTDPNKLYILSTNQHVYVYNAASDAFVDTGIVFGNPDEYFAMRGYLANGSDVSHITAAGAAIIRPDTYTYTGLPDGFTTGTVGWTVTYIFDAQNNLYDSWATIVMQPGRYWLNIKGTYVFDSLTNTIVKNTALVEKAEIENNNRIYTGGVINQRYGGIGHPGRTGVNWNEASFDLRDETNRYFLIPLTENDGYIYIQGVQGNAQGDFSYGLLTGDPGEALYDRKSFANLMTITPPGTTADGKLQQVQAGSRGITILPEYNARYLIINYKYGGRIVASKIAIAASAAEYALGNYVDWVEEIPGLKGELDDLSNKVDNIEPYDIVFNIENNYCNHYMNQVSYINYDDDYSVSFINFGEYKPMDSIYSDNTGSKPNSYELTWPAWNGTGFVEYLIEFGDQRFTANTESLIIENFAPGVYNFKIYAISDGTAGRNKYLIKEGQAKLTGQVRMLNISNIYNCRDLGGWQTIYGKNIKYDMFFRSAELDDATGRGELTAEGKAELAALNITAEIDVDENAVQTLDHYSHYQVAAYEAGLVGELKDNYGEIINQLADNVRAGYATLIHCKAGADRTGTISFILEALLGVPEDKLSMDYELSSMNDYQYNETTETYNRTQTPRSFGDFAGMVDYIKGNYTGNNLNEKVEALALDLGATAESIEYLRANCLE